MKVQVAAPYQVSHAGVVYGPGDTAEVPDDVGLDWLRSEWVVEVKVAPRSTVVRKPTKATT